jgi:hypothetical protein
MMAVVTIWTFYPVGPVKFLVIAAYVQTSIRTAVEGWHYSVDFILPAVLCWLIWRELAWVYPVTSVVQQRPYQSSDPVSKTALFVVVGAVGFCILNAFYLGA